MLCLLNSKSVLCDVLYAITVPAIVILTLVCPVKTAEDIIMLFLPQAISPGQKDGPSFCPGHLDESTSGWLCPNLDT